MPAPNPALAQLYANVSERDWQASVEAYLTAGGWLYAHIRDARGQHVTGLPDIIAVRAKTSTGPAEIIALELKRETGKTTKEQDHWLDLLRRAGVPAYVLRPSQVDTVKALLVDDQPAPQPPPQEARPDGAEPTRTDTPATKTCTRCGQARPLADFLPDRHICRVCRRAYERAYAQRQREQDRAPFAAGAPRPCIRCGEPFTPRVPTVEECRACLLASVGVPIKRQGAQR